jgi:hypothetical protein
VKFVKTPFQLGYNNVGHGCCHEDVEVPWRVSGRVSGWVDGWMGWDSLWMDDNSLLNIDDPNTLVLCDPATTGVKP